MGCAASAPGSSTSTCALSRRATTRRPSARNMSCAGLPARPVFDDVLLRVDVDHVDRLVVLVGDVGEGLAAEAREGDRGPAAGQGDGHGRPGRVEHARAARTRGRVGYRGDGLGVGPAAGCNEAGGQDKDDALGCCATKGSHGWARVGRRSEPGDSTTPQRTTQHTGKASPASSDGPWPRDCKRPSTMPRKRTIRRARRDRRRGESPSTQAGEFVGGEMRDIREGKHGARNTKQAIAIGLSEARRAGVKLPPPRKGTTSARTRKKATEDEATGQGRRRKRAPSKRRARTTSRALKREGRGAASPRALSRQAKQAAAKRKRRGPTTRAARRTGRAKRAAE